MTQAPQHGTDQRTAHVVETLQWDCHFHEQALAQAIQPRLGRFLNGPALRTMDRLFERISPPGEVWHIDRLEIDMGVLRADASMAQWEHCLEEALWRSLQRHRQALSGRAYVEIDPRRPHLPSVAKSANQHALDNFLYYIQHGRLPWTMNPMSGPQLADWLADLARRTGPRLWQLLHQLRPSDYTLARLSRIAPHQGLHALLAVRHADLAESLTLLDNRILAPLQARGRLSVFQVQQIQQAWRVAGLTALWDEHASQLSANRLQQLMADLVAAMSRQLGMHWTERFRPLLTSQGAAPASDLAQSLLSRLIYGRAYTSGEEGRLHLPGFIHAQRDEEAGVVVSQRLLDTAMARLGAVLDGDAVMERDALLPLLEALAERSAPSLRARLQYHVLRRANRRAWLSALGPRALWMLMQQLVAAPRTAADGAGERHAAQSPQRADAWAESLRQFTLGQLQAPKLGDAAPLGGVSSLQAWLVDYTLAYLAEGHPLPQDHVAWQCLWQQAMASLLGEEASAGRAGEPSGQAGDPSGRTEAIPLSEAAVSKAAVTQGLHGARHAPGLLTLEGASSPQALGALLQRWMRQEDSLDDTAALNDYFVAQPAGVAAAVRRWVQSVVWVNWAAGSWSEARKLRLLVLLEGDVGVVGRLEHPAQALTNATERWQWLPAAIRQYAAHLLAHVAEIEATADSGQQPETNGRTLPGADPALLVGLFSRRLWADTIKWVAEHRAAPIERVALMQYWRQQTPSLLAAALPNTKTDAAALPDLPAQEALSNPAPIPISEGVEALTASLPRSTEASGTPGPADLATVLDALLAKPARAWRGVDRLRIAALLETPAMCEASLAHLKEVQRWQLLAAQFPNAYAILRLESERLKVASQQLLPRLPAREVEDKHWRFLFGHCFVLGLPLTAESLYRRYALHLCQMDQDLNGHVAVSLQRWQYRLGEALLAHTTSNQPLRVGAALPQHGDALVNAEWVGTQPASVLQRLPSFAEQWEAGLPPNRRIGLAPIMTTSPGAPPASSPPAAAAVASPAQAEAEPIYLGNAGLVLLANYNPRLFSMLGLLKEGRFVDQDAQTRAVHCLAFLADGHSQGNETEWVLNKFLCGVPLSRPLPPCEGLDDNTLGILESLLKAIIAHWSALGNTSVAGLREVFLRRDGRLLGESTDEGMRWQLKVKSGPYDMLIDRLPWSFSTIKASWMETALYVDWR